MWWADRVEAVNQFLLAGSELRSDQNGADQIEAKQGRNKAIGCSQVAIEVIQHRTDIRQRRRFAAISQKQGSAGVCGHLIAELVDAQRPLRSCQAEWCGYYRQWQIGSLPALIDHIGIGLWCQSKQRCQLQLPSVGVLEEYDRIVCGCGADFGQSDPHVIETERCGDVYAA